MQIYEIAPQGPDTEKPAVVGRKNAALETVIADIIATNPEFVALQAETDACLKSLGEAMAEAVKLLKASPVGLQVRAAELVKAGDTVGAITELRRYPNRMG